MKLKVLTITGAVLLVMLIIWAINIANKTDTASTAETSQLANSEQTSAKKDRTAAESQLEEVEEKVIAAKGQYIDYTPEAFTASTTEKNVINFDATWCYVCDAIEENILDGEIPEDLTIFKADFDTEIELRKKYGVTSQTTFVQVTPEGDEITKWVMYDTAAGINEIVAELQ